MENKGLGDNVDLNNMCSLSQLRGRLVPSASGEIRKF